MKRQLSHRVRASRKFNERGKISVLTRLAPVGLTPIGGGGGWVRAELSTITRIKPQTSRTLVLFWRVVCVARNRFDISPPRASLLRIVCDLVTQTRTICALDVTLCSLIQIPTFLHASTDPRGFYNFADCKLLSFDLHTTGLHFARTLVEFNFDAPLLPDIRSVDKTCV